MNNLAQQSRDYGRIEEAIRFLDENFTRQPSLKEIAHQVGMSEFHFQKIFQQWAGISPKKFLQFLTKEYAKELLKNSNVLDTSYEAGLSGAGRLHDLFIKYEAVSPGEYKLKGKGMRIVYGFHPTPFGECFIALTERGICSLFFLNKADRAKTVKEFTKDWTYADIYQDQKETQKYAEEIFIPNTVTKKKPVKLLCRGTNFQIKVWEALLRIPYGKLVTYQTIAKSVGSPKAVRAVGTAIGRNPISYIIPCHRVIRSLGELGGYRWGLARKHAILAKEASVSS